MTETIARFPIAVEILYREKGTHFWFTSDYDHWSDLMTDFCKN